MFYKVLFSLFSIFLFIKCLAQEEVRKPVPIIFDTDIGSDYDDAGAITILHVLADRGEAEILATVASNKYEGIAALLNVFNTYFHRPEIPIGITKGKGVNRPDHRHWTDTLLIKYPHKIKQNGEVADAVKVYRKVLAAGSDRSITIVTVGFLTNLANLMNSPGDSFSGLGGEELIKKKVKLLVCMGGEYPSGKENNLEHDVESAKRALENWPTPVIFSGYEIGAKIKTGLPLIHNNTINNSPIKDAFRISIPMNQEDSAGRMSWDQTAVLVAIKGYRPYYYLHEGKIKIDSDGSNTWNENGKSQYYLVEREAPKKVQEIINYLMMQQPQK